MPFGSNLLYLQTKSTKPFQALIFITIEKVFRVLVLV